MPRDVRADRPRTGTVRRVARMDHKLKKAGQKVLPELLLVVMGPKGLQYWCCRVPRAAYRLPVPYSTAPCCLLLLRALQPLPSPPPLSTAHGASISDSTVTVQWLYSNPAVTGWFPTAPAFHISRYCLDPAQSLAPWTACALGCS